MKIDFIERSISMGAPSAHWLRQMSAAIAFGLVFATILTLVGTPSGLMARAKLVSWEVRRSARDTVIEPAAR